MKNKKNVRREIKKKIVELGSQKIIRYRCHPIHQHQLLHVHFHHVHFHHFLPAAHRLGEGSANSARV